MLRYYMLRVDSHEGTDMITRGLTCYSWVLEAHDDGENPHAHYYLETILSNDAIRKRVKTLPDFRPGNGFYSLRELRPGDDEVFPYLKYHAYMAKIQTPYYYGFRPERLVPLKAAISLRIQQIKHEQSERRKARRTILEQMEEEFNYEDNPPDTIGCVIQDVINFYLETGRLVREFAMVSQVQTLALRYLNDEYSRVLHFNILQRVCAQPQRM